MYAFVDNSLFVDIRVFSPEIKMNMRANKYRIRFLGDGFSLMADPPGGVTRVVYGTR